MKTYEKTHPWINFHFDFRGLFAVTWEMLGECKSKIEHIKRAPLRPDVAAKLHKVYLAKGVRATTAIEGNTLTEEEVQERIEGRGKLPPSREYLGQEVDNIINAANDIMVQISEGKLPPLSVGRINDLNRMVLYKLDTEEGVVPGQIRNYSVGVGTYRGAPWEDCQFLLEELARWLNEEAFDSLPGGKVVAAIVKAIIAHLYIAWIHPYGDGNGRTARLIELQILISSGIPTPVAHLLSNHYNLTRTRYYGHLDKSKHQDGLYAFVGYAVQGLLDGLSIQLDEIMEQVVDVSWRNYVYEEFRNKTKDSDLRKRALVLDLSSRAKGAIPINKIQEISALVMNRYKGKANKTFLRDIAELEEMGLIEKVNEKVRVKKEIILKFLPKSLDAYGDESPGQLNLPLDKP